MTSTLLHTNFKISIVKNKTCLPVRFRTSSNLGHSKNEMWHLNLGRRGYVSVSSGNILAITQSRKEQSKHSL